MAIDSSITTKKITIQVGGIAWVPPSEASAVAGAIAVARNASRAVMARRPPERRASDRGSAAEEQAVAVSVESRRS